MHTLPQLGTRQRAVFLEHVLDRRDLLADVVVDPRRIGGVGRPALRAAAAEAVLRPYARRRRLLGRLLLRPLATDDLRLGSGDRRGDVLELLLLGIDRQ